MSQNFKKQQEDALSETQQFADQSLFLEPQPESAKLVRYYHIVETESKRIRFQNDMASRYLSPKTYTFHFKYLWTIRFF